MSHPGRGRLWELREGLRMNAEHARWRDRDVRMPPDEVVELLAYVDRLEASVQSLARAQVEQRVSA